MAILPLLSIAYSNYCKREFIVFVYFMLQINALWPLHFIKHKIFNQVPKNLDKQNFCPQCCLKHTVKLYCWMTAFTLQVFFFLMHSFLFCLEGKSCFNFTLQCHYVLLTLLIKYQISC